MQSNKQIFSRQRLNGSILQLSSRPLYRQRVKTSNDNDFYEECYPSIINKDSPVRQKKQYKFKLPPIKTIRYLIRQKNPQKQHNFMNPTNNSIQKSSSKQLKQMIEKNHKLCSICSPKDEIINKKKHSSIFVNKRNHINKHNLHQIKKKFYYPSVFKQRSHNQLKQYYYSPRISYRSLDIADCYYLRTQFAKQLTMAQKYYPQKKYLQNKIVQIPSKQNVSQFIRTYECTNEAISISHLLQSPYFLIQYSPKELYFGEIVRRQRHGIGILIQEHKAFEGQFSHGQQIRGVEINVKGVYKGQFQKDKKEGKGQFSWYNGEYYLGDWKNNKRDGDGLWLNSSGDSYKGEWVNGKGEGYGVYLMKDQKYEGGFMDFKKHGWGKQLFPCGDKYEGQYRFGQPDGQGKYSWANGTIYEGEFIQGLRTGKGVVSNLQKFQYQGQFIAERPQGLCEITMPNGDVYDGTIKNGKKHGRGVLYIYSEQRSIDGYWQEDVFINKYQ